MSKHVARVITTTPSGVKDLYMARGGAVGWGTALTSLKVAGSIPDDIIVFLLT